MNHPDAEVRQALTRLLDALCSWERATSRGIFILREKAFVCRAVSGKPDVSADIPDSLLVENILGSNP